MTGSAVTVGLDAYAVSRAYLVPVTDFEGRVHSVFEHACNIQVGDLLMTVHDASIQHSPASVRVALVGPESWSPVVRLGDRASKRAGVLSFGRHVLDLSRLPVWTPRRAKRAVEQESAYRRLALVVGHRRAHPATKLLPPEIESAAHALVALLIPKPSLGRPAFPPGDNAAAETAVGRLVGAGAGLTPAGDDILVGLLAVLALADHGSGVPKATFARLSEAVLRHAHLTNDISAHYLRLAAGGHFSEPLTELVDAFLGGSAGSVLSARTADILSVGASSGADALLGVLIGLEAVLDSPLDEPTLKKVVA